MSKKLFLLPALLLGAFLVFTPACGDDDACKDVECGTNGACFDGNCVCDDGYEIGTSGLCDTESRAKFYGNYNTSETCSTGNGSYSMGITAASGTDVTQISISNFGDSGLAATATVDGDDFTVASTTLPNGVTISGSGTISGNTITLNYTGSGPVSFTCTAVMTRQ